jgi:hypothetical protein
VVVIDKELELALHAEVLKWGMDAKQRGVGIKAIWQKGSGYK